MEKKYFECDRCDTEFDEDIAEEMIFCGIVYDLCPGCVSFYRLQLKNGRRKTLEFEIIENDLNSKNTFQLSTDAVNVDGEDTILVKDSASAFFSSDKDTSCLLIEFITADLSSSSPPACVMQ